MGKSSPRLPPTPDPNALINAQADANRITQYTPQGNLRFGSVGDQGQFVEGSVPDDGRAAAFTEETPFQAQMRAAQEGTGLGLGNVAFNLTAHRYLLTILISAIRFRLRRHWQALIRHKTLTQPQACQPSRAISILVRQYRKASIRLA